MTALQQRQHDELQDLATHYQWIRALFLMQRDGARYDMQRAIAKIEAIDRDVLRVHERLRDLASEVERTEGVRPW